MAENLDRAKYLIYRYAHDWFIQVRLLNSSELELALNLPVHGLATDDLLELLYEMFADKKLVASRRDTGLFTPSRNEISLALHETPNLNELFYGYTSGAVIEYNELDQLYGEQSG